MITNALRRGVLATFLLAGGMAAAQASPLTGGFDGTAGPSAPVLAPHRPGYHARQQYRRALRRYRGHPGAQFELRQNRRIYCRNTPERC